MTPRMFTRTVQAGIRFLQPGARSLIISTSDLTLILLMDGVNFLSRRALVPGSSTLFVRGSYRFIWIDWSRRKLLPPGGRPSATTVLHRVSPALIVPALYRDLQ